MESFEGIYLDLSKQPGKCRIAESGLGWKPLGGGETFTLDGNNIINAQWSRAAKGHELRILARPSNVIQLDGFADEDYDRVSKAFKLFYGVSLEQKEHALRGWNWGKGEFGKAELMFSVQNRPAFEIPYSEISNANLAGKTELAVEFSLGGEKDDSGTNGALGGARAQGRKAAAAKDQLQEIRFFIPGVTTSTKKEKVKDEDGEKGSGDENEEDEEEQEEEEEQQNAANVFYDTLMDKAEIGEVAGDTVATFLDVLHLTPRGRFDVDMYDSSFRLRGKTYDYKIQFSSIKKFLLLPKPDDVHTLIVIGLDPPLRQGQTRYPFLVMQFKNEEEVIIELNLTEETLASKYSGRLQPKYESTQHTVIAAVFRGLTNKRVTAPSKDFSSHHGQSGVKCSIKASEGILYFLDKAFMFVPKPATYVTFDTVATVVLSRVGGAVSASRTFDVTVEQRGGTEITFSNINKEEQSSLIAFLDAKNLKTRNEMLDDQTALTAALKSAAMGDSDSEDEVVPAGADRGSADEDEESVDEDFQTDDSSDVAEEYDSQHDSSGSGDSDAEMADGNDGRGNSDAMDEDDKRPKKKAKVGK